LSLGALAQRITALLPPPRRPVQPGQEVGERTLATALLHEAEQFHQFLQRLLIWFLVIHSCILPDRK